MLTLTLPYENVCLARARFSSNHVGADNHQSEQSTRAALQSSEQLGASPCRAALVSLQSPYSCELSGSGAFKRGQPSPSHTRKHSSKYQVVPRRPLMVSFSLFVMFVCIWGILWSAGYVFNPQSEHVVH